MNRPAAGRYIGLIAALAVTVGVPPALADEGCSAPPQETIDDDWLERNQARIGEIRLQTGDVFDTSKPGENKSLFRLVNFLHINTRPATIRDQLLFRTGDVYSRRLLDENERLLRKNRYFIDAHIFATSYCNGVVDLTVRTRDVWTLNIGASASRNGGANHSSIELEELNLLGLGSKLSADLRNDVDRNSLIFEYSDQHVGRNQLALSLKYANSSDGSTKGLLLDKPFYALDSHWAAGFEFLDDERVETLYDLGEPQAAFRHLQSYGRIYGGLSKGLDSGWVSRWTAGLAYDAHSYLPGDLDLPPIDLPVDRTLAYPFVGYELREDRFITTRNQNQMGRTEDIYLGTHVAAELGYSSSAFGDASDALIYSLVAGTGIGDPAHTMWQFDGGLTGRYEGGEPVDARLSADARYYRRQSDKRLLFVGASMLETISPAMDDPVYLGGGTGLRGYPLRYQGGDGKVSFTIEQRYFTDWYPFKLFRVGGAAFADAGRTWGANAFGNESLGWLSDVGIGLRLAPTRSSSGRILHLDVAFPLQTTPGMDKVQILLETRRSF